ncbi:MAG: hypothetical protein KF829_06325 [Ferruginibacter sp.]|nr:hypothetical protein [Ferruginibacter sp.]
MKERIVYLSLVLFFSCTQPAAHKQKEKAETPEQSLRDSMAKYPDSLIFVEDLIQLYRDSNQYNKAISETEKQISRFPANDRLYDILATLYFENEDTTLAASTFEKAFALAPGTHYAISLGTMYAYTANPRALTLMDTLILVNPEMTSEADFIKGLYFSATANYQKAISLFDTCIHERLTFMEAYREKSWALFQLGKYQEALGVINTAITLQNNFEEGYFYKGKYLEKLNRPTEAAEAYQMALLYAPDYEEAQEALNRLEK